MPKFPVDAPQVKVIKTLEQLGFTIVREREHIAMIRQNDDGTSTPLTLPNHKKIKGSTLRSICNQSGISRQEFLSIYETL
ncbi:type II toxin-antitoxin system HicA family toxin [Anabaena sp. FACHB-1237]|uniref:type II toxin-antitoxin system HicA family toxin n=1 Tax=Anabaena sp. FACHB-1237 TaxID=2692769 RepID=UPI00168069A8|nr:type II toxin-antitoxin system HicA family toxin [Anabaena sp. FACHB-1237]MBD2138253.1 type II toxin-antitoxin system HicA family toxin [Anabaena sp. FACHB-1237]